MEKIRLRMNCILRALALLFGAMWCNNVMAIDPDLPNDEDERTSLIFTMPIAIQGSHSGSVKEDATGKNAAFSVGIDTIRYVRGNNNDDVSDDYVSYDAHAMVQIPFASGGSESTIIRFEGKNLMLAGEGESRLELASTHRITIQENKIYLEFSGDNPSWINLSCNGVTGIHLAGKFIFEKENFISPANPEVNQVEASFEVDVPDWDDMVFEVNFNTPFKVKGAGDFVFTVTDAIVDFSTVSNATGFTFPAGYDSGLPEAEMWTGFALKRLNVTFPKDISFKKDQEVPLSIGVHDLLIDQYGLTGSFLAANVYPLGSGNSNSGVNFGIDTIGVTIIKNIVTRGKITGAVEIPMLKDMNEQVLRLGIGGTLAYDPSVNKILYKLSADMLRDQTYRVPFADTDKATITVAAGSYFDIGNDNKNQEFGATLSLNGSLNIDSELAIKGVQFEGLKLSSLDPHFQCDKFGLVGSLKLTFGGFSISLEELSLRKGEDDKEAVLHVAAKLALMGDDMGIAASTGLNVHAVYGENNSNSWKYKRISVDFIELDADFSAFHFYGRIDWYDNHPQYGKGFHGDIEMDLKSLGFGVKAEAYFGTTDHNSPNPYKYWFVKATADVSGAHILLFPPGVFLKSIKGGAYQHMSNNLYTTDFNPKRDPVPSLNLSENPTYLPDPNVKFGFIVGISAYFAEKNLVSIEAQLEMAFNNNWGLNYVSLRGFGAFMSEKAQGGGLISAAMLAYYDRENSIFHTQMDINADIAEVIKVTARVELHSDPDNWWFYLGRMDAPVDISLFGLVRANSYFMAGLVPTSLPPLNPKLTALFGITESQAIGTSAEDYKLGRGFAFGVSLSANCGFGQKKGFVFAYIELEGGTDALVRTGGVNCGGSDLKWRGYGQAYVYFDGAAGIRIRKKYTIVQLTVAAALNAEFPAPYYLSGKVAFRYRVLFVKGTIKRSYSTGKHC